MVDAPPRECDGVEEEQLPQENNFVGVVHADGASPFHQQNPNNHPTTTREEAKRKRKEISSKLGAILKGKCSCTWERCLEYRKSLTIANSKQGGRCFEISVPADYRLPNEEYMEDENERSAYTLRNSIMQALGLDPVNHDFSSTKKSSNKRPVISIAPHHCAPQALDYFRNNRRAISRPLLRNHYLPFVWGNFIPPNCMYKCSDKSLRYHHQPNYPEHLVEREVKRLEMENQDLREHKRQRLAAKERKEKAEERKKELVRVAELKARDERERDEYDLLSFENYQRGKRDNEQRVQVLEDQIAQLRQERDELLQKQAERDSEDTEASDGILDSLHELGTCQKELENTKAFKRQEKSEERKKIEAIEKRAAAKADAEALRRFKAYSAHYTGANRTTLFSCSWHATHPQAAMSFFGIQSWEAVKMTVVEQFNIPFEVSVTLDVLETESAAPPEFITTIDGKKRRRRKNAAVVTGSKPLTTFEQCLCARLFLTTIPDRKRLAFFMNMTELFFWKQIKDFVPKWQNITIPANTSTAARGTAS